MRRRHRRVDGIHAAAVDLGVDLGPVHLPNPIVTASGTFGHGDELGALCDPAQLGAVTVKSLAAFAWPGNPPLRVTDAAGGGMCNSIGLAGPGVEAWITSDLPALEARHARVIASVWGRTVDDYAAAAAPLKRVADRLVAVEVNLSCPNVEERSAVFAHAPQPTTAAIGAVVDALGGALPVFAKLSPNVTDLCEIARAALDAGATGLTLINTVMALVIDVETRRPKLGAGGGGLSGPPIKPIALRAVWDVSRAFPGTPIIGTGGVSSGADAAEMLLAGASAVGVGTATFADPRAPLRILDELRIWCARHSVANVKDLVGVLEDR
ncbi:MAG: dihydroorotate dehydrogenase catalytic subunit [Actinomycetota bacterium]|nr:dihydroorotate dehydrogenase catalytic subunit [Actinomycetota bacterium]